MRQRRSIPQLRLGMAAADPAFSRGQGPLGCSHSSHPRRRSSTNSAGGAWCSRTPGCRARPAARCRSLGLPGHVRAGKGGGRGRRRGGSSAAVPAAAGAPQHVCGRGGAAASPARPVRRAGRRARRGMPGGGREGGGGRALSPPGSHRGPALAPT